MGCCGSTSSGRSSSISVLVPGTPNNSTCSPNDNSSQYNKGSTETLASSALLYKKSVVKPQQSGAEGSFDSLSIDKRARSSLDLAKLSRQRMAWLRTNMHIEEVYDVLETIGHGSMGEVTVVAKKKQHQEQHQQQGERRLYACKSVRTTRMTPKELDEFLNEIDVLRELLHPNIIQMFEIYATKNKVWIVTELCKGGNLGEYARRATQQDQPLSEEAVALLIEQILRAVTYMHRHSICHRDLKFENIMILDEINNITDNDYNSSIVVKLIDFGLGSKFTKGSKMGRACGTVYTAAPEILLFRSTVGYTEKADIWSIGVLAYMLLTHGQYPFLKDREELHDQMKRDKLDNAEFSFPGDIHVSVKARTFVSNCLKRYPGARWSAIKALTFLQEEWIPSLQQSAGSSDDDIHTITSSISLTSCKEERSELPTDSNRNTELQTTTIQNTNSFTVATPTMGPKKRSRVRMETCMLNGISAYASTYGEFKKRVLLAMAYQMDKTSITKLRDLFFAIDTNNIGTLTVDELKGALNQMHADKHLSASTIEKMFKGIDVDGLGTIHYHEFLAALLESQGMITEERLADAFERIDSEGKGYISKENLKSILGPDYNSKMVDKMIKEVSNGKHDGKINYQDFLRVMAQENDTDSNSFFRRR